MSTKKCSAQAVGLFVAMFTIGCVDHPMEPSGERSFLQATRGTPQTMIVAAPPASSVIFDQGPATGTTGGCLTNDNVRQNLADVFSFATNETVASISIFTCTSGPRPLNVRIKILADGPGAPTELLYKADVPVASWVAVAPGIYQVTANLPVPFSAVAGTTYWIGMSGETMVANTLGQLAVHCPRDCHIAQFNGDAFVRVARGGDQMFQLHAPVNAAPLAAAGPDQVHECTNHAGAFTLDGSASTDADGTLTAYEWRDAEGNILSTSAGYTGTQGPGSYTYTLTVTDDDGATASDAVTVTIQDTQAPSLSLSATPSMLWPPNHEYRTIALGIAVSDACERDVALTAWAVSSEPDDAPNGDGKTTGDIKAGANSSSNESPEVRFDPLDDQLQVRAERGGRGDGRTYTVYVRATDASGNTITRSVEISVRHNN